MARTALRTANPSRIPLNRAVVLMPDAMPALPRGTAPMMAFWVSPFSRPPPLPRIAHAGDDEGPSAAGRRPSGEEVAQADHAEPEGQDMIGGEPSPDPSPDMRQDQHGQGEGQHGEAGIERRASEPVLQVEWQERCHDLCRGRIGEHRDDGADEARNAEQREVQHGPGVPALGRQKDPERHGRRPQILPRRSSKASHGPGR